MSKLTKRKHVVNEVMNEYVLPQHDQSIVKILAGRGNNLHEVVNSNGEQFLVSMPKKFRKNVWIKRGDFVIVEPIMEGDKVKAEIVYILYKDQIKYIREEGCWPSEFDESKPMQHVDEKEANGSSGDSDSDLFVNTNRPDIVYTDSEEDSSSPSEEDECSDSDLESKNNDIAPV